MNKQSIDENDFWKAKKDAKREKRNNQEEKANYDYNTFLQDIEEDPEIRQNVNLYRDEDVIEQLESQMAKMNLKETEDKEDPKKSPMMQALDKGSAKVDG